MIVVSILGILAAIVYPEFKRHVQQAKEAQAKANLKLLREAIERYAADHNGVPPGYPNNDPTQTPNWVYVFDQLTMSKKYLSEIPKNPFNSKNYIHMVPNNGTITPDLIVHPTGTGWIYHPASKTFKIYRPGTDSEGIDFFDY